VSCPYRQHAVLTHLILQLSSLLPGEQLLPGALLHLLRLEMLAGHLILKVQKNENFFGSDFEFCTISL
jgi:hypothetical protein